MVIGIFAGNIAESYLNWMHSAVHYFLSISNYISFMNSNLSIFTSQY